ncbi:thioredoxin family protein [Croceitalea rosinachiae]|uniref:Thioredoxin family protein n=1 Tax=Croceitalea rosinachiae TaxID=3075596 RepID=A0ABU3AA01_9FLAO|nr:thioredoxin family protein [Croceitalea sp. F388]MDT0606635.1 thioredoxin family protein [Croceitalea sp. F388]
MNTLMENPIKSVSETIQKSMNKAMTYEEYRNWVSELVASNSNSGPIQTDALVNYTQLNDRRMKRWDKTLKISEEYKKKITNLNSKATWLVLTESWCGDASPSLPVMNKMAELNSKLDLKIVLRDENLELMNLFLTNEAQSIPKLIALDSETNEVLGEWGPRPSIATKMVDDYKVKHGKLTAEFKEDLQVWYNKDKGQNILEDLVNLLTLK